MKAFEPFTKPQLRLALPAEFPLNKSDQVMKAFVKQFMKGSIPFLFCAAASQVAFAADISSFLYLKTPGNPAISHALQWQASGDNQWSLQAQDLDAMDVQVIKNGDTYTYRLRADEKVHFNLQNYLQTDFHYENSDFLLPGLWYKKNLRSSDGAPTVKEATNWSVREDRLSTPLTGVYSQSDDRAVTVLRMDDHQKDAVALPGAGEMILSGHSDLGSVGFGKNEKGVYLQFGYPYIESPKTYVRKLTLAPESQAFVTLDKGQSIELNYQVRDIAAENFSAFVKKTWEYSYDVMKPEPVEGALETAEVKALLSQFYTQSYIDEYPLKGFSGIHLLTDKAEKRPILEVGFIGRVLLNAFNALEYGDQVKDEQLSKMGRAVFDSYLQHGFDKNHFLKEYVDYEKAKEIDVLSIRRQSEGVYAILLYLQYEKDNGRNHPKWEEKTRALLDKLVKLQRKDGSFPRKFTSKSKVIDPSGGSSASAVLSLVMGYNYFDDKKYLNAAKGSVQYLEDAIVSQAEYFSSTLDANSVDKEASFYTATAFYYLALVSEGEERKKYTDLADTANYFVMSWYYTWDVPFAKGQMLGDVGFKTRGWGNVSVENNHVDVFIFGYLEVLNWLAEERNAPRLAEFAKVIESSMKSQLLPRKGHMVGIAKVGYYPEVVQHTNWDYGHFGKGFYNTYFAPGWVVASLWEMLSDERAQKFLAH